MPNDFLATAADHGDLGADSSLDVRPARCTRRLKICFISETLHAGVGRHIVDVVLELSRRGHEIHLLYSPIRCDPQFLADLKGRARVRCTAIPMPRAIGFGDLRAFAAIRNYARTQGPFDVIHGQSSKGGGYARLLKGSGPHKVLYNPHAFVTLSCTGAQGKLMIYRALERTLAWLTDQIICTSQAEAEHARILGIGEKRLTMIPNGCAQIVEVSRDTVRASLGLTPAHIVVGFAGRMEDQKAPERLISAALRLLPELPELRLLMVGDGPKRAPLEARLVEAGLEDRATWLGAVDARAFMPAMDIFVVPSLYEGFAYVFLEALQAGLPIVATPVGGAHESVAPGVNGMIVPHGAPAAMDDAIRSLTMDATLRRKMAQASRARAAGFSISRMVDAMESLYLRTVGPSPFQNPRHVSHAELA